MKNEQKFVILPFLFWNCQIIISPNNKQVPRDVRYLVEFSLII